MWPLSSSSRTLAGLALGVIALCGCQSKPEITRRYADLNPGGVRPQAASRAAVRLSAFVKSEDPPPAQPGVTRLSAEGQSALVAALASEAKGADLLRLLGRPLGGKASTGAEPEDRSKFDRRVIFGLEKSNRLGQADRIALAEISLSIEGSGRISEWNRFSNDYGDVDLGKVTLKQDDSQKATVSAGPYTGEKLPVDLGLEASHTRSLTEELALKQRYVKLTGVLETSGKAARLLQEGAVGIDLVGNSLVDLTVTVDSKTSEKRPLYTLILEANKAALEPSLVQIRMASLTRPARGAIKCVVSGEYLLRRVEGQAATIMEGDDQVRLERGLFASQTIELVPAATIDEARRYFVVRLEKSADASVPMLHLRRNGSVHPGEGALAGPLQFKTFEAAEEFIEWLRGHVPNLPPGKEIPLGHDYYLTTSPDLTAVPLKPEQVRLLTSQPFDA